MGTGANSLTLDLHLILGHSGFPDEKTILTHYFNASGLSFDPLHVCSVNFSVHLPLPQSHRVFLTPVTTAYRFEKGLPHHGQ